MFRRVAVTIAVVIPLSCAAMGAAHAATAQAKKYFGVRDKTQLATGLSPQQLQLRGKQYLNRILEVKGVVTGSARRADGGTVVVRSSEGDLEYLVELGADVPETQVETGQNVRLLCKIAPIQGSEQVELRAVAVVSEYEAMQVEQERVQAATNRARLTQPAGRPQLASRGSVHTGIARRPVGAAAPTPVTMSPPQVLAAYRNAVKYFNKRISDAEANRIARNIIAYSERYGLDARLVMAVVACESNFNPNAVSRVGAMGLGQLMPGTAAGLGVADPFNHEENLRGSTELLSGHINSMARKNGGQVSMKEIELALACYNAGAGAVKKYKGIPPYRETQNYVKKVTSLYRQFLGPEADGR